MSVDPSHYLPGSNGGKPPLLKLQNISARPELNGQFGQAVSFSAGRYVVAVLDASTAAAAAGDANNNAAQPTFLKLKPENLAEAGSIDQLKFGAGMLVQSAKAYVASPSVQRWGQRIVDRLPPSLQSKMTPDTALLAAAIAAQSVLFLILYFLGRLFGSTKVFMLLSLVALLLAVSSPDWMEGYKAKKPIKLIVRSAAMNFPFRWKDNLVNMTGYAKISDKMALASLVLILLFSGKVLLTPSPSRPPQMPNIPAGDNLQRNSRPPAPPQYDLEYVYKLGFDDANSGKDFGTSLPEDIIKYNAAQESLPAGDQYGDASSSYDWSPPPPPRSKSNFGIGTLMSIFTLYRFGKDLVTSPDGALLLDPQYIMVQLKSIETWRLGIMGMSLYRVVTSLSSFFR